VSALTPPRLRGVLHTWCWVLSVPAGFVLVATAPTGRAAFAGATFAFGTSAMFGVSALFHRTVFDDHAWYRFRRLDHMGIYLCIAGGFTPFGMIALDGWAQNLMLIGGWVGAAVGMSIRFLPFRPPYGLMNTSFLVLGWIPIVTFSQMWDSVGATWMSVTVIGGVCYTLGAFVVGLRRPDPWPLTFGYHEIWHSLVAVAATLVYLVVAFGVLPLDG
jgi:hemolysin III